MTPNELKKQNSFPMNWQRMHDLLKVGKSYNRDLHKVSKMAVKDSFNMPKVRRMT